tara:strand:- start:4210 stop:5508 length:1299 start_codon:yes stop_codon:yes gene_type:complete
MPKIANIKQNTSTAYTPFAYAVDAIELTTHDGTIIGIDNFVTEFSFEESIDKLGIMATFKIKDVINMLETYQFCGQEKLNVKLSRQEHEDGDFDEINLDFIVTSYPVYGKDTENSAQAYVMKAVSPHIYYGQLKQISRAFDELTVKEITRIFAEELNFTNVVQLGKCASKFQGVYPSRTPLETIKWLKRHSYTSQIDPFMVYATIAGDIRISSLAELLKQTSHGTYVKSNSYSAAPNTAESYAEQKHRILTISSNLKMGKLGQAMKGVFGSTHNYVDLSTKKVSTSSFTYSKLNESQSLIDTDWDRGDGKTLEDTEAYVRWRVVDDMIFDTDHTLINRTAQRNNPKRLAKLGSMEAYEHEIEIAGDFNVHPGTIITINIPKAGDRKALEESEPLDEMLSGDYLVTAVVHSFKEEYRSGLRLKRNICPIDLNE